MADEINNQSTEEIAGQNEFSRSQQRIKELSDKVELTAKERDAEKEGRSKEQQRIAELERENSFNGGFVEVLGQQPNARDFKDQIKEKVMAGLSVEDATFAVLGKAGKLGITQGPIQTQVAGGSADTAPSEGQKSVKDMTQAERREELSKVLQFS